MVPAALAAAVGCAALVRRAAWARVVALVALPFLTASLLAAAARRPDQLADLAAAARRCRATGTVAERSAFGAVVDLAWVVCPHLTPRRDPGRVLIDSPGPAGAVVSAEGWLLPLPALPRGHVPPDVATELQPTEFDVVHSPRGLHRLAQAFRRGLVGAMAPVRREARELLEGLTIGDTDGISPATVAAFRRAGLSHVLAVSGSNVAVVVGAVFAAALRAPLRVRLGLAAAALVLFVLVVGPEPSVLRAALVAGGALAALGAGMRTRPLHVLSLATVVLLLARPWLVFAPGLHLSVAATAGILLWARSLARWLSPAPRPVAVVVAVTLAAQLAVAPISIATFGEVSLVAPLANALALPAVAPATVLGLAAAAAATLHPELGRLIARAAAPFAQWVLQVGETCGSWEWAAIHPSKGWGWIVAAPVCLAAAAAVRSAR